MHREKGEEALLILQRCKTVHAGEAKAKSRSARRVPRYSLEALNPSGACDKTGRRYAAGGTLAILASSRTVKRP
jgi:hypothetical protein